MRSGLLRLAFGRERAGRAFAVGRYIVWGFSDNGKPRWEYFDHESWIDHLDREEVVVLLMGDRR